MMQMTQSRSPIQVQQQRVTVYAFPAEQQADIAKSFQDVKTAQQELQSQAAQSSLSGEQAERLKRMTVLVGQVSAILEQCRQTNRINENQWRVVQQLTEWNQTLQREKLLNLTQRLAEQLTAQAVKQDVAVSTSAAAAAAPPPPPKKPNSGDNDKSPFTIGSASSAAAASGAGDPPDGPGNAKKGDPSGHKKAEPRSRWTVLKDSVSRYFTHGAGLLDLALSTVIGGVLAIGTPVAAVTIPLTYAAIASLRTVALASRLMQDPNGDSMNQLYARWQND